MRLTPSNSGFERLADMAEGRLSGEETADARTHLASCTRCSSRAAELDRVAMLMRSDTSVDAPRDLVFGVGDFDVDLRLAAGEEGWTVSGQVLGPCEGGRVEAFAAGVMEQSAARASLNDLCEFTLPPVPEGVYALRLRLNDTEIEIPELSLKA